jgi:hypothetical protein
MTIPAETLAAVQRGARVLDEVAPGWFEQIDLSVLDVASDTHCILGQLAFRHPRVRRVCEARRGVMPWARRQEFGIFAGALEEGAFGTSYNVYYDWQSFAFCPRSRRDNRLLTSAWKLYITARRDAAAVARATPQPPEGTRQHPGAVAPEFLTARDQELLAEAREQLERERSAPSPVPVREQPPSMGPAAAPTVADLRRRVAELQSLVADLRVANRSPRRPTSRG